MKTEELNMFYENLFEKQTFFLREFGLFEGHEEVSVSPFYTKKRDHPIVLYTFPLYYIFENEDIIKNKEQKELIYNIQKPKKLLVFEFDNENIAENAKLTKRLIEFLGFEFLLLYTGNKSFHVWIPFSVDIYSSKIVEKLYQLLEKHFPIDLELTKFDKQIFLSEKTKIRMPFSIHHKTLVPSYFMKEPLKFLKEIEEKNIHQFDDELKELIKKYKVDYNIIKIVDEVIFDKLTKFYDIEEMSRKNTKLLFDLFNKYQIDLDKSFFNSISDVFSIFEEKLEVKEIHENKLFEKRLETEEGKQKIFDKILNYIKGDLKDGKQRAVGILYALSVLKNKGSSWFISQARQLPYFDEVKSKINSYLLHYDNYKKEKWVSWGWVINRYKEIKKDNEVI